MMIQHDDVPFLSEPTSPKRNFNSPVSAHTTLGSLKNGVNVVLPSVTTGRSVESTDSSSSSRLSSSSFRPPRVAHRIGSYIVGPVDEKVGRRKAISTLNPAAGRLDCFVCSAKDAQRQIALRVHLEDPDWLPSIVDIVQVGEWAYFFYVPTFGSLLDEIGGGEQVRGMDEGRIVDLFGQMVDIVEHCHRRGVVLRDLTLRCFAYADESRSVVKLLTIEHAELKEVRNDRFACRFYACPEMFVESRQTAGTVAPYSGKGADVWSLGVIFYALLVGCYPFFTSHATDISAAVCSAELRIPQNISGSAARLLQAMLARDPRNRFTAAAILQHPFLFHRKPTWVLSMREEDSLVHDAYHVPSKSDSFW